VVTYTIAGELGNLFYYLANTATVIAPGGLTELDGTNNSATTYQYTVLLPLVFQDWP
jgi:hypothetical protein